MDTLDYLRFFAALVFVLGLIALLAWVVLRYRLGGAAPAAARRLAVIETLSIDSRHRLALVRCDAADYLLLLGEGGNLVVTPEPQSRARDPVPLKQP